MAITAAACQHLGPLRPLQGGHAAGRLPAWTITPRMVHQAVRQLAHQPMHGRGRNTARGQYPQARSATDPRTRSQSAGVTSHRPITAPPVRPPLLLTRRGHRSASTSAQESSAALHSRVGHPALAISRRQFQASGAADLSLAGTREPGYGIRAWPGSTLGSPSSSSIN